MQLRKYGKRNKVVLDTNILVSGLINPAGSPSRILQLLVTGIYQLLLSEDIFREYQETLERFPAIPRNVRKGLLAKIRSYGVMIRPPRKINVIKEDPEDDKFLECAFAGRAATVVSGDRHLVSLKRFRGIQILKAVDFLRMLDVFLKTLP